MMNIQQTIISSGIYFLSGFALAILFNYFKRQKQVPVGKWSIDQIPLIPAHPHLVESMNALAIAPKLTNCIAKMDRNQIAINSITITDITWFSAKPDPLKLGFVKMTMNASDITTGKKIASNIVFARGDSIAILIIVKVAKMVNTISHQGIFAKYRLSGQEDEYVLLCDQMRLASGSRRQEICAGMMDAEGNIASVVLKEVKEETGFDIKNKRELIQLGSIYPSPGACDEEIFLYAWTTTISELDFKEKQSRVFGDALEGEEINLNFVPIKEFRTGPFLMDMKDVKAECAFRRYESLRK
jgi:ADP-sugar diphosphatase